MDEFTKNNIFESKLRLKFLIERKASDKLLKNEINIILQESDLLGIDMEIEQHEKILIWYVNLKANRTDFC